MTEPKPDAILDVRGDACPYPFVRAKWLMEQIASGEVLKVVANGQDALENIDSLVKRYGDKILRIENEDIHHLFEKKAIKYWHSNDLLIVLSIHTPMKEEPIILWL